MSDSQPGTAGSPHLFHHSDEGERQKPTTSASHAGDTETNPTVSATGMPRIIPRHADERGAKEQDEKDAEEGSAPSELGFESGSRHGDANGSDAEGDDDDETTALSRTNDPHYAPSGSLTIAALSPSSAIPFKRRLALLTSSLFINLGLPFINGVMLGFGEIFARVVLAPALGITGVGWNGTTDRARVVSNPFSRRQTSSLDAVTAGGDRTRSGQARWTSGGAWSQGASGTIDDIDEEIKERTEERGEELYL
ncbi:uncharacterized protein PFL1_00792 [Pseudozyma flocculosa PF-1]|uniref:Related to MIM1 \|nr:uncharacterized protein PFL1_00792 [Pseudozyma flocculosa PF-1]EPQ31457.1 hypothetical protein PFL1_00792 [Pseudozyma flocculosa PF-1]SPO38760.1 related to MIM1 \